MFGVVVILGAVLLITRAWGVVDAHLAVDEAAKEGVRLAVEAASEGVDRADIVSSVEARAREVLRSHGRSGAVGVQVGAHDLDRCSVVQVTVTYRVHGTGGVGGIDVRATHAEIVDPLRTGVGGDALCVE